MSKNHLNSNFFLCMAGTAKIQGWQLNVPKIGVCAKLGQFLCTLDQFQALSEWELGEMAL